MYRFGHKGRILRWEHIVRNEPASLAKGMEAIEEDGIKMIGPLAGHAEAWIERLDAGDE